MVGEVLQGMKRRENSFMGGQGQVSEQVKGGAVRRPMGMVFQAERSQVQRPWGHSKLVVLGVALEYRNQRAMGGKGEISGGVGGSHHP